LIQSWLIRWGLSTAIPFLIPGLIGLIFGGGFIANWWFQWLQISDVVLLIFAACLIYLYAIATSEWAKLLYVLGLVGCAYVGGRFHEHDLLKPRIKAAELAVHKMYKDKHASEVARLEQVNKELTEKHVTEKIEHMSDRAKLRKERDDAIAKANKAPDADTIVFTPDDVDLLNKLRHSRKRTRVQGRR
jgi:hypothetical protein